MYGSSIKETANVLFTSTAFVSKIRTLYRQRGEVNRKRRKGRQRILSCKLVFVLFNYVWFLACVAVVSVSFKPSGVSAPGNWAKRSKKSRSAPPPLLLFCSFLPNALPRLPPLGLKETETTATQTIWFLEQYLTRSFRLLEV